MTVGRVADDEDNSSFSSAAAPEGWEGCFGLSFSAGGGRPLLSSSIIVRLLWSCSSIVMIVVRIFFEKNACFGGWRFFVVNVHVSRLSSFMYGPRFFTHL